MLALIWLLSAIPASANIPVGAPVEDAVVADITKTGFNTVADALPAFLPESFAVPNVNMEGGCVIGSCAYRVNTNNGQALFDVGHVNLDPATGVLNFDSRIHVRLNQPSSPLELWGNLTFYNYDCDVWVNSFPVDISASVNLSVTHGELQAVMTPLDYQWGLTDNHIQVNGCAIDTIASVLDFFGWSLYDFVIDQIEPQVDDAIANADIPGMVEGLIEDAFAMANFSESFDLLGKELYVDLWADSVQITNNGMRVGMAGAFDADVDRCVERFGYTGALATPSSLPGVGNTPSGMPFPTSAAIYVDDDFLNSALFTVWSSGLLCYDLHEGSELDLPLPMNTALLGLLAGDLYDDLFPEEQPIRIQTRPEVPPEVFVGLGNDANLIVDPIGLELYAELDGRQVRVVNIDLAIDAGVDLHFNGTTGVLGVDVHFDGDRVTPTATFSDLVPEAGPEMETRFSGIFNNLVVPLLADTLSDLNFPLPSFEGIGLGALDVRAAGSADDRLGAYAAIGTAVPYNNSAGCGCDGDSEGCDTGCGTGGLPARGLLILLPLMIALRRRNS